MEESTLTLTADEFKDNGSATTVTINTDGYNAHINTLKEGDLSFHKAYIISNGDDFINAISGESDAIKLLIKAVNNRTIERDYFKLYCEMLGHAISEEDFDREIDSNEKDYVISEKDEPTKAELKMALRLSEHLKGVESMSDFTALFSFNYKKIESLIKNINGQICK